MLWSTKKCKKLPRGCSNVHLWNKLPLSRTCRTENEEDSETTVISKGLTFAEQTVSGDAGKRTSLKTSNLVAWS